MSIFNTIKKPILTEKSLTAKDNQNKYGFIVDKNSNKYQIKEAVEKIFKVTVTKVNIIITTGKMKRVGQGPGGKLSDLKKAIVTLKSGDKIDAADTSAK